MKAKQLKDLKDLVSKEQEDKCLLCGTSKTWHDKPLVLQLDHIDGNRENNKRSNLRVLCPNCHTQTDTWCGRGRGKHNKYTFFSYRKEPRNEKQPKPDNKEIRRIIEASLAFVK